MITQETINSELDLAKRIYIYYLDKMATYLAIGSGSYVDWYKDLCTLYYLTEQLQNVYIVDDIAYIGGFEIDEDDFSLITSDIREYINYDIRDIVYTELDSSGKVKDYSSPSVPPIIVAYQSGSSAKQPISITIETDGVTEITLPFNLADVVESSITGTVNDNDPMYIVSPSEEGFHIVGNTLFWHTYYELKVGDILRLEYTLIA